MSRMGEQIMVRMSTPLADRLRRLASDDDRSLAYVVRQAVDHYLRERGR